MEDLLAKSFKQIKKPKPLALGYPVNREHAFKIDLMAFGITPDSFASTFINNVGSAYTPKTFSIDDIREVEQDVLNTTFAHLGGDKSNAFGYITSGGTEGNFAAIWWHREYLINKYSQQPVIIASNKSHYSVDKIANQLQLKLIKFNSDRLVSDLETFLISNTSSIIFWANIGTTVDGTIDDIQSIKFLLNKYNKNNYKIHADGAIYGLLIPYIEKLKSIKNIFTVIDSISISGHKFLGSYNICGILLTNKNYIDKVFANQDKKINIIRDAIDFTASGSRPGLQIIELYLLLQEALIIDENGRTKLEKLWNTCLETAKWFYLKMKQIVGNNKLLWFNPYQLSMLFPAPNQTQNKLEISKKYSLMPIGDKQLGIYIFPRSTKAKLIGFLNDYKNYEIF